MTYILIYLNIGALCFFVPLALGAKRQIPLWKDVLVTLTLWPLIYLLGIYSRLKRG
jgi:hypothetical protein